MSNTKPLIVNQVFLDDKLQRAANKCLVNYGFFRRMTAENLSKQNVYLTNKSSLYFEPKRDCCLVGMSVWLWLTRKIMSQL